MIQGLAGQAIGAQMINATSGGAFGGTVTVYITGDGGTQAIGSTGGGVCTAEGNGYYSYVPTAAETNYALIAFTFVGSGAVPATIQVATVTPQQAQILSPATGTQLGQVLLNLMEVLHPELQLQVGESDVTKALVCLNAAQDYMETVFAMQPDLLGDMTGTVTTTQNTERTLFPTGLLRLDKVQYLDVNGLPVYDLTDIKSTGGHIARLSYPAFITSSSSISGAPNGYYTDGRYFYWNPLPDATYTLRWYGFQSQADITAASLVAYPDVCLLPLATFAVRIERLGLDDDVSQYQKLATDVFEPVVNMLGNFQRERAPGFQYRHVHST